jgi:hypothetical protein
MFVAIEWLMPAPKATGPISRFPATKITEVKKMIDPTTAG